MNEFPRWDRCISTRGEEFTNLIRELGTTSERKYLLIAGAGFDPRAPVVSDLLCNEACAEVTSLLIKELRPNSTSEMESAAESHEARIASRATNTSSLPVRIFADDNAVVGGRAVVAELSKIDIEKFTDVVVDISAMSLSISFPVIRYALESMAEHRNVNVHAVVAADSWLDSQIIPENSDAVSYIHGFRGGMQRETSADAALLWMPQLAWGRRVALDRIYQELNPHDVLPILPFPASDPLIADKLLEHFGTQLEDSWQQVDARNLVYAAENDPTDLYRTILRINRTRLPVFEALEGSKLILSPVGSKVMALGALMAAYEDNLPVAYIESNNYKTDEEAIKDYDVKSATIVHVWLQGEAY